MELSIIVPVYRVKDYLEACVESLLRQDLATRAEILLVDDGSPDECGRMCDALAEAHPEVRALHRPNGGLSAARNTGLEVACGRYVTFVDSDDVVALNTYAPLLEVLAGNPTIDLLEYPVCRHCGTRREELWFEEECDLKGTEAVLRHWMTHYGYRHTYAWNKIYRRELFDAVRYPEGRYYEDTLTILPLLHRVQHYRFVPTGGYLYYDRPGAISQSNDRRKVADLLEGHLEIQRELRSHTDAELLPYRLEHLCTVVNTMIDLLDTGVKGSEAPLRDLWREVDAERPSLPQLLRLPLPAAARLKGLTWVLLGTRAHCLLNHAVHKILRH
jgi:glycosyltransferase involved in cell wall biosynthesis